MQHDLPRLFGHVKIKLIGRDSVNFGIHSLAKGHVSMTEPLISICYSLRMCNRDTSSGSAHLYLVNERIQVLRRHCYSPTVSFSLAHSVPDGKSVGLLYIQSQLCCLQRKQRLSACHIFSRTTLIYDGLRPWVKMMCVNVQ